MANVSLIEPLDYEPFVWCMKQCCLILSDSGNSEEARTWTSGTGDAQTTERPEAIKRARPDWSHGCGDDCA